MDNIEKALPCHNEEQVKLLGWPTWAYAMYYVAFGPVVWMVILLLHNLSLSGYGASLALAVIQILSCILFSKITGRVRVFKTATFYYSGSHWSVGGRRWFRADSSLCLQGADGIILIDCNSKWARVVRMFVPDWGRHAFIVRDETRARWIGSLFVPSVRTTLSGRQRMLLVGIGVMVPVLYLMRIHVAFSVPAGVATIVVIGWYVYHLVNRDCAAFDAVNGELKVRQWPRAARILSGCRVVESTRECVRVANSEQEVTMWCPIGVVHGPFEEAWFRSVFDVVGYWVGTDEEHVTAHRRNDDSIKHGK